ncbi:SHOCT domain-containing protein [Aquisalimonas sp.]|uniref:SHOCT domain-containing protein n=1 Tax=Aquisalimonas sp. TaxID=1872621 RepID=UPI0025C1CFE5|nr:SHOCT domain-containing protein [Aquisalimonas sp.]
MPKLTPTIRRRLARLAKRYEVSEDAALAAFHALSEGGGRMAQFYHPEFGGGVQWMRGGMTMIGDMFNNALRARVDGLCTEISDLIVEQSTEPAAPASGSRQGQRQSRSTSRSDATSSSEGQGASFSTAPWNWAAYERWWPESLGTPSATGAQNELAYAIFPEQRRVVIRFRGLVRVYDTGDHRVTGISQQQSRDATLTFTSQTGTVVLDRLRLLEERGDQSAGND